MSSNLRVVRLKWGGESKVVNIWSGCPTWEMRDLIQGAFSTKGTPVALVAEASGIIVPLSVACRYPETLEEPSYRILQAAGTPDVEIGEEFKQEEAEADEKVDEKVDKLTALISKFAKLLEASGRMTPAEAAKTTELAAKRDPVIFAAYAVSAADQNADQLATLLMKIAKDFLTTKSDDVPGSFDGPTEHAVAEQLLIVIDDMFSNPRHECDLAQTRRLQRKVLNKDPVVFAAFDVYSEDGDANELFDTLLRVSKQDDDDDDEKKDMEPQDKNQREELMDSASEIASAAGKLIEERRFAVFQECTKWLVDKGQIKPSEGDFLLSKVNSDAFLRNAFATYAEDNDLEPFLDALAAFATTKPVVKGPAPAPPTDTETELVVLTECLRWLEDKNIITRHHVAAVLMAARDSDPRVQAAMDMYAATNDLGRFLETLSVVARLTFGGGGEEETTTGTSPTKKAEAMDEVQQQDDDDFWERDYEEENDPPPKGPEDDDTTYDNDDAEAAAADALFQKAPAPADDDVAVVEITKLVECLVKDSKLRDLEHDRLRELVDTRDPRLLAAFDVYQDTQDVDDLVDTLLRLAKPRIAGVDEFEYNAKDDDDDEDRRVDENDRDAVRHLPDPPVTDDDDDDDDDVFDDVQEPSSNDALLSTFLGAFEKIAAAHLSDVEAAAIQLCAARSDDILADAITAFQSNADQDKLVDQFKAIAHATINQTVGDDIYADPQ